MARSPHVSVGNAIRVKFKNTDGADFWTEAWVLEKDADQWMVAGVVPHGYTEAHLKFGDRRFLLATGVATQFQECAPEAVPKVAFRQVFKAYVDYLEGEQEMEYLTASDDEPDAEEELRQLRKKVMGLEARLRKGGTGHTRPEQLGAAGPFGRRLRRGLRGCRGRGGVGRERPLATMARSQQGAWPGTTTRAPPAAPARRGLGASSPGRSQPSPTAVRPSFAQTGSTPAGDPAKSQPNDFGTLLQLELLRTLNSRREPDELYAAPGLSAAGSASTGRGVEHSLRSLHVMKKQVITYPEAIIADFIGRTRESLGVRDGQVWNISDLNRKIMWGKHRQL
jgi:hypothetical protein